MKFPHIYSPLGAHEILNTSNPEFALDKMSSLGALSFAPLDGRHFCLKVDAAVLDDVLLAYEYHGEGTYSEYNSGDHFWQVFSVDGHSKQKVRAGGEFALSNKNWSMLVEPHNNITSAANKGYQQLTSKIKAAAATRLLSAWLGRRVDSISVKSVSPCHSPMMQSFRRTVFEFAHDLDKNLLAWETPVLAEMQQVVILKFLTAHRHNFSEHLLRDGPSLSVGQLSNVEEYIAANFEKPLNIEFIAQLTNSSARSIFRHFRAKRNCTPHEFVKRTRLEFAQKCLLSPAHGVSVTAIALKAGFSSLGHFARSYEIAFGEKPSETLAKSRKTLRK